MSALRPNIVFISSDQQGLYATGASGNPWVRTPSIDALAASGVSFRRAYCTYPLCTPARASHFTGCMPQQVGVTGNEQPLRAPASRMMGPLFRAAGYETVWAGKWHLPQWYPDRSDTVPGFRCTRDHSGADDATVDRAYTDDAVDFIRGTHEQPFLLSLQLHNPHQICSVFHEDFPSDLGLPEDPALLPPVDLADRLPEEPEVIRRWRIGEMRSWRHVQRWSGADRRRCAELLRRAERGDDRDAENELLAMRRQRWDELSLRRYRWYYYRLVELMDEQVGRVLRALQETGLEERTVVVFTSDHGEGAGAHRWLRKFMFYNELVRVPLVVRWPGVARAGSVNDTHVVSGVDLLPTLCDAAGITWDRSAPGRSMRPCLEPEPQAIRNFAVAELCAAGEGADWSGRMLVTAQHKYMVFDRGARPEMLFDLAADPGETVNVARYARYADVRRRLARSLKEWCQQTGDAFRLPTCGS